jgi:biotin-dependent carboxylase-like uncharacterized protein
VAVAEEPAAVVEVLEPGLRALVEDLGRPGLAEFGVGRSGAVDLPSLQLGNRLVGNRESAAGIELTLGAASFRFHHPATVAVTGAPAPVTAAGRPAAMNSPVAVGAGAEVRIGRPTAGVRSYLVVRGGIAVPPVLGSRSRDTLAGLGPPELRRGDLLPIGTETEGLPLVDHPPVPGLPDEVTLRVWPGPRVDWFAPDALDTLFAEPYQVTPSSDRVGMRLRGRPLRYGRAGQLPPEGMVTGALQVPPEGQPVLFLADHPVTGGYPVIGVVLTDDVPLAAQSRPGQLIRLRPAGTAHASVDLGALR